MNPLVIVKVKILLQSLPGHRQAVVVVQIDLLIFHRSPQPFDKDVIKHATSSVHADPNPGDLQSSSKGLTGELHPLIAVEDFGLSLLQGSI